jgi:hypothetical protein
VAVGVERDLGRGVPQPGPHGLHVGALGDQERREVVPQVMIMPTSA